MTDLFGPNFAYGFLLVGVIIGFVVGRITAPKAAGRSIGGGPRGPMSHAAASVDFEVNGEKIDIDPEAMAKVRLLAAQGEKIEAIKHLRDATGLGLAEAKQMVEALERMKP